MPHKMTVYDTGVNESLLGPAYLAHRRADVGSAAWIWSTSQKLPRPRPRMIAPRGQTRV